MKPFNKRKFYKIEDAPLYRSLFFTGMIQVFFVALNTYFLANTLYTGVMISSFMISMIWSYNVKRIAFGEFSHRMVYALGATLGSIGGLWLAECLS